MQQYRYTVLIVLLRLQDDGVEGCAESEPETAHSSTPVSRKNVTSPLSSEFTQTRAAPALRTINRRRLGGEPEVIQRERERESRNMKTREREGLWRRTLQVERHHREASVPGGQHRFDEGVASASNPHSQGTERDSARGQFGFQEITSSFHVKL